MFPTMHLRLGNSKFAIVDALDYEIVAPYTWHAHKTGYAGTNINGKYAQMHRLILDAKKGQIVDHINGDRLDNRRANLRFVTALQNSWNACRRRSAESPRGVKKNGVKFVARITANGVNHYLGTFSTSPEAESAYVDAAALLHGEFAGINRGK